MMVESLNAVDVSDLETDVAIVGGGTVGLLLAKLLSGNGLTVTVLESGGRTVDERTSILNGAIVKNDNYSGASDGRIRGLGGTSNIWGGAMLPFAEDDFERKIGNVEISWPVKYAELISHLRDIEDIFGLSNDEYDVQPSDPETRKLGSSFNMREAKWPPFRRRNVWTSLKSELLASEDVRIICDATLTDIALNDERQSVHTMTFKSLEGASLDLKAKRYVLTCGAIENTRQLLMLNRKYSGAVDPKKTGLGGNLQDHLSIQLAQIDTKDLRALNKFAAFRFEKGMMRSLRFEFAGKSRREASSYAGFVHLSFEATQSNGFDAIRDAMRALQSRKLPIKELFRAMVDLPYVIRMVWWRLVYKRLLWPAKARVIVNIVVEQAPEAKNRIGLSSQTDALMTPIPTIDWSPTDRDVATFNSVATAFDEYWKSHFEARFGAVKWRALPGKITMSDLSEMDDIYHPCGTTILGSNPENSVLDENLSVHSIPNIFALSTASFPNGGVSNPTVTLALFAGRLAEHMLSQRSYLNPTSE